MLKFIQANKLSNVLRNKINTLQFFGNKEVYGNEHYMTLVILSIITIKKNIIIHA